MPIFTKDGIMEPLRDRRNYPSNVRQGRFLWMSETAQRDYLTTLKQRISEGYYYSDGILSRIAEDLAPMYAESSGPD
jgi:hypothetical protein